MRFLKQTFRFLSWWQNQILYGDFFWLRFLRFFNLVIFHGLNNLIDLFLAQGTLELFFGDTFNFWFFRKSKPVWHGSLASVLNFFLLNLSWWVKFKFHKRGFSVELNLTLVFKDLFMFYSFKTIFNEKLHCSVISISQNFGYVMFSTWNIFVRIFIILRFDIAFEFIQNNWSKALLLVILVNYCINELNESRIDIHPLGFDIRFLDRMPPWMNFEAASSQKTWVILVDLYACCFMKPLFEYLAWTDFWNQWFSQLSF